MSENPPSVPLAAKYLGGFGIIPFVATLVIYLFARTPDQKQLGLQFFVYYSAIILSFLGGIRWGAALPLPAFQLMVRAVLPSLVAFGCLLVQPNQAVIFLAAAFAFVGWTDATRATHALWPEWFKRLRLALSVAVVSLHLILLISLGGWV